MRCVGAGNLMRRFAVFALLTAVLGGCATTAASKSTFSGNLTAEQKDILRADNARVLPMIETLVKLRPIQCRYLITVTITGYRGMVREIDNGLGGCTAQIIVGHDLLAALPDDQLLAVLSHEWSHILHRDGAASPFSPRRRLPAIQKEREADEEAAHILSQISSDACLALVRLYTTAAEVETGRGVTHPPYPDRAEAVAKICAEQVGAAR